MQGNTTQSIVGIEYLFRGWIVKNWNNVQEFQPRKVGIINKIIIKKSVLFYTQVQKYRNEVMHDSKKYRLFVIKQYEKVVESIEKDNRLQMYKYLYTQRINVDQCNGAYIRHWILSAMKMKKITEVEKANDIRRFFTI